MNLNQDFQEFVELFVAHEVEFLIVGGYALAAHGHPRYTRDLDVWVWIGAENAQRIITAIGEFGFGELGLTAADFQEPDVMVQLGREPQRIDILTFASGLHFADASKNWNDSEHWWITNLLLGDIIVPYMGWAQAWSEPCEKKEVLEATDQFILSLSNEEKELLKSAANAEQRTKEQQLLITSAANNINDNRKAYRDSLNNAIDQGLKQWEIDSTGLANQHINDKDEWNRTMIEMLYSGGAELEKTTGVKIKDQ